MTKLHITDTTLATRLADGQVGILPTDTLYGLVASAKHKVAVSELYALKERDQKPGTVIAASIEQLEELGLKHRYVKAVEQYWPGPISVIIPCGPELDYLHQGKWSLAVRIPDDEKLRGLLTKTGPLLTSSANTAGNHPAGTAAEAEAYFGKKVDFYVDGGDLTGRAPSTIIRILDDAIEVVRQGAVTIDENGRITQQ
jgi:L-threonylcarbamoyladenylate synthase